MDYGAWLLTLFSETEGAGLPPAQPPHAVSNRRPGRSHEVELVFFHWRRSANTLEAASQFCTCLPREISWLRLLGA